MSDVDSWFTPSEEGFKEKRLLRGKVKKLSIVAFTLLLIAALAWNLAEIINQAGPDLAGAETYDLIVMTDLKAVERSLNMTMKYIEKGMYTNARREYRTAYYIFSQQTSPRIDYIVDQCKKAGIDAGKVDELASRLRTIMSDLQVKLSSHTPAGEISLKIEEVRGLIRQLRQSLLILREEMAGK